MELPLSSEQGGDLVLGVWAKLGDHSPRPSTGSTKVQPLVLGTALGCRPGLCMWLLGSGKWSSLLTRMECKEVAQSQGSAVGGSCPTAPNAHPHPKGGGAPVPGSLELLAPPAHSLVCQWVRWHLGSGGYWGVPTHCGLCSPLLTLRLLEPPGEVFDAHVLELEQVLQAFHFHLQHLHGLL